MSRKPPSNVLDIAPVPDYLPEILRRLRERYVPHLPTPRRFADPLEGVIRVILSQQNTWRVAQAQWEALRATYPVWEAAHADGPDGIETTLKAAGGGLTRMKADYIYGVLDALDTRYGSLNLRFLHDLSDAGAREVLAGLPGVGMKTASLVLLFDLKRPAIPVDNHIERWAKRLELVPAKWNAQKVERWFDAAVPRDWETRYALHLSGVDHGQETCKGQRPLCARCVLLDFCPAAGIFLQDAGATSG